MTTETDEKTTTVPHIYAALVAIGGDLAKVGVAKDRVNEMQKFHFRGIDEIQNTCSPIFARHGVVLAVKYHDYPDVERVTGKGSTLIYSKVRGEFTFISAKDGSCIVVTTFGVAMDSGDKAVNKAMSAALKYALLQTFLIPTEGEGHDADESTPEPSVAKPAGFDAWFNALVEVSDHGTVALKKAWDAGPKEMKEFARVFRDGPWTEAKKWAGAIDKQNASKAADAAAPPFVNDPEPPNRVPRPDEPPAAPEPATKRTRTR